MSTSKSTSIRKTARKPAAAPRTQAARASKPVSRAEKAVEAEPPRVTRRVLRGGYVIYSSPVQPRHFSRQQIAEALASLE